MNDETIVRDLNFLLRTYDGINKLLTSTKNRLHHLNPEAEAKHQDEVIAMEAIKRRIARRITQNLEFFPIWTEWMAHIPGIAAYIAGNLVILYYFRFVPICKKCQTDLAKEEGGFKCPGCGQAAKGEGILQNRIELKDFANISSWWHYLGLHTVNGKKPRKKKGQVHDWNDKGREMAFQIGDQFIKKNGDHLYRQFYNKQRAKRDRTHPDATKLHKMNMARNETGKLFLAHFWQVARTLDGLPVTAPYAQTILGHTGILEPFYWSSQPSLRIKSTVGMRAMSRVKPRG